MTGLDTGQCVKCGLSLHERLKNYEELSEAEKYELDAWLDHLSLERNETEKDDDHYSREG